MAKQAPKAQYRRKHYFINRPLQMRFMVYVLLLLLGVMAASIATMYYGIWGSVLKELSDEGIRNKVIIANRIYEYEQARTKVTPPALKSESPWGSIREMELLSHREREVFQEILGATNRRLLIYFLPLLVLIGWGTIFLSHRIAGPLYRFEQCFKSMSEGDLTVRARLRKHDEAVWLAEYFNTMTENLDSRITRLREALREGAPKETLEKLLSEFKTSR